MDHSTVRPLVADDFAHLSELEHGLAATGQAVLGAQLLRLGCEMYADTCFIAMDGARPVGYLLCFIRDRVAHCLALAVRADYQLSRVPFDLLRAFVGRLVDEVDVCWFTVDADNATARSLHRMLGAVEAGVRPDYHGPGRHRIVAGIDRNRFAAARARYLQLGLLDRGSAQGAA